MKLATQPTLLGMEVHLSDRNRKGVGTAGEITAQLLFEKAGYAVRLAGIQKGDLTVIDTTTGESWNVEVKTSRRNRDGKWRFKLFVKGHTSHLHADVVLLLAVLKSGRCVPFLVPVAEIANQRQAVICSHPDSYSGKLAQYRQIGVLRL